MNGEERVLPAMVGSRHTAEATRAGRIGMQTSTLQARRGTCFGGWAECGAQKKQSVYVGR